MQNTRTIFETVNIAFGAHRVSARVAGEGAPLILFHSLLADRTSFDLIAGPLSQTHQVIVLDLPGFGDSDRVDGGLEALADRLADAIRRLGLKQLPIFLGNGYGGFAALLTSIRHPGIAARLVLADCGACFSEAGRAAFKGMSAAAKEKGLAAISEIAMARLFGPEFRASHPELLANHRNRFLAMDLQTLHNACNALATLDLRHTLSSVKISVLVLVGEHDEATPPAMSQELAAGLAEARLVVLTGCAHVPQLQDPALFLSAIREFINNK